MANAAETRSGDASEASVAELVKQLSEQTSRLARLEVELAKAELAVKGKRAGLGVGMFGGVAGKCCSRWGSVPASFGRLPSLPAPTQGSTSGRH